MSKQLDFTNKTIIVTGGGKGVGLGITKRFLQAGANVVICGRSELEKLPEEGDNTAVFFKADVLAPEQIQHCVDFTIQKFGGVDVLVNNAGGAPYADAATASPRFSEKIIALNLLAPLSFSQSVNKVMQEQKDGGCIINIASVSAVRSSPGTAAYGAAKAGLLNLTASLGIEWAPKVRVNAAICGMVKTELAHLHYGDEQSIKNIEKTVPLGRLASPEDVGDTCLYLASPLASYVTGSAITVHGGGEKPSFLDASDANH